LRFPIEIAPCHAGLCLNGPLARIHVSPLHTTQVNDNPSVAGGKPGDVVAATANGQQQVIVRRETNGRNYIGYPKAANDGARPFVDHPIPNPPS
jgi:hypothetical protein